EDEEEDEEEKGKGGKGVSTKLLLGIGLGVVAIGLLGAVGYFIFAGDKPAAPKTTPVANIPAATPPAAEAPKETKSASGPAVSFDAATNLLPGNVEGLCNLRMGDLPSTGLGRTMFTSPGALQYQLFKQQLGLALENIDLILQAWNFTQNWSFNVV